MNERAGPILLSEPVSKVGPYKAVSIRVFLKLLPSKNEWADYAVRHPIELPGRNPGTQAVESTQVSEGAGDHGDNSVQECDSEDSDSDESSSSKLGDYSCDDDSDVDRPVIDSTATREENISIKEQAVGATQVSEDAGDLSDNSVQECRSESSDFEESSATESGLGDYSCDYDSDIDFNFDSYPSKFYLNYRHDTEGHLEGEFHRVEFLAHCV